MIQRRVGDSRLFAPVPKPGHTEGIAIDGDTVFSGTTGDAGWRRCGSSPRASTDCSAPMASG